MSHAASSMRIITLVRMLSQMRGGAKKYEGPISFRSCRTVEALSGQLMVNAVTIACAYEST
ncbi:MAG: hypothetical protein AUI04_07955 [Candidatus Rokubacteria bacterium 13_2_20CM_2_64_8]|nr:MAG: hypothetical protein AUI04_07955 [Candidatus Rokubacteria bacterium 13_2_20CM_2_64_8]